MNADINAIADEIAANIKASPVGVFLWGGATGRVFGYMPDSIEPPTIGIAPPAGGDFLMFDDSMGTDAVDLALVVTVALGASKDRSSQFKANQLLMPSGNTSLRAAINGFRVADVVKYTTCDFVRVLQGLDYGTLEWPNSATYMGFRLLCMVKVS